MIYSETFMVITTVTITDYYYNTPEYEFSNTNFSNIWVGYKQVWICIWVVP